MKPHPAPHGLALQLGRVPGSAPPEAYHVETAGDVTTNTGSSAAGVFHSTRTLLQVRHQKGELSGRITDWPTYPQRGLMVDVGRKHARCRGKQQKGQAGRSVRTVFEGPRERAEHIVGSFADRFPTRVRLITGSTPVIRRAHHLPDAEGLPRMVGADIQKPEGQEPIPAIQPADPGSSRSAAWIGSPTRAVGSRSIADARDLRRRPWVVECINARQTARWAGVPSDPLGSVARNTGDGFHRAP
ncbi:glycoside hydrolase family 20 zincin-like fold domain-containing protein [Streptomyces yanii]|uniref:Glycoside hydrolase family 20 zincin-like fold domain-containing protein n=1 Tax=Streptomyces yanii TaxID=78510 RepID=A0ABV5R905_9ACTN